MSQSRREPADRAILRAQLAQSFFGRVKRVLVVKAIPDEEFCKILSAIQQALPGVAITCLVSGDAAGPEDEVGDVLRGGRGLRALCKKSLRGFDLCVIAMDPSKAGGCRRLAADLAALLGGAKEKALCSPEGFFGRSSSRASIVFAPFISGIKLAAAVVFSALWAAISLVIFAIAVLIGGVISLLFARRRNA